VKHNIDTVRIDVTSLYAAKEMFHENENILEKYIDLLLEWNQKINLVSRNVSRETLREHIVHSLLPLPLKLTGNHPEWIDAGTGGGLPGIPLAICQPELKWLLNDNIRKKMKAVDDIVDRMKLENCRTIAKSISLVDIKKDTGITTKHAFKIPDLLRLLGKSPWETILMWKGTADAEKEILECRQTFRSKIYKFDFGKDETFYEGKCLVLIRKTTP
jgi:16S rRNA (guanine527-N7)-methyltransferase